MSGVRDPRHNVAATVSYGGPIECNEICIAAERRALVAQSQFRLVNEQIPRAAKQSVEARTDSRRREE